MAEASDAGMVERGWLPRSVPLNAVDVVERHDLDTNTSSGFFSVADASKLPASTNPMDLNEAAEQIRVTHGDRRVEAILSAESRWSFCEERGALPPFLVVIDRTTGAGMFWTGHAPCY
jgi:hypothetical protein